METGTVFFKDGKEYRIRNKQLQNQQAVRSGLTFKGKPMHFKLKDADGIEIPKDKLYVPHYAKKVLGMLFQDSLQRMLQLRSL